MVDDLLFAALRNKCDPAAAWLLEYGCIFPSQLLFDVLAWCSWETYSRIPLNNFYVFPDWRHHDKYKPLRLTKIPQKLLVNLAMAPDIRIAQSLVTRGYTLPPKIMREALRDDRVGNLRWLRELHPTVQVRAQWIKYAQARNAVSPENWPLGITTLNYLESTQLLNHHRWCRWATINDRQDILAWFAARSFILANQKSAKE